MANLRLALDTTLRVRVASGYSDRRGRTWLAGVQGLVVYPRRTEGIDQGHVMIDDVIGSLPWKATTGTRAPDAKASVKAGEGLPRC